MRLARRGSVAAAAVTADFSPDDLASLYAWYDASAITGLSDGDPITTLADQANSYDLTGTGAARPTYETNERNGLPVMRFTGSHYLAASTASDWTFLSDGTGSHVFCVANATGDTDESSPLVHTGRTSSSARGFDLFRDGRTLTSRDPGCLRSWVSTGSALVCQAQSLRGSWPAGWWQVVEATYDYSGGSTDMVGRLGNIMGAPAVLTSSAPSDQAPAYPLTLGSLGNQAIYANADIAEVLVFNERLSDANAQSVREYLANKWAVPVAHVGSTYTITSDTTYNAFPGAVKLADGTIMAAYRAGPGHGPSNADIDIKTSTDNGATWSAASTAVAGNHGTAALSLDGTDILLASWENTSGQLIPDGGRIYISSDNGTSWAEGGPMEDGFTGSSPDAYSLPESTIVVMPNGDYLCAVWGKSTGTSIYRTSVKCVKSTDGGDTWTVLATIADGPTDSRFYNEAGLWRRSSDGLLVAALRTDGTNYYESTSDDDGATWSAPTVTSAGGLLCEGAPRMTYIPTLDRAVNLLRGYTNLKSACIVTTDGDRWQFGGPIWESDGTENMMYGQPVQISTTRIGFVWCKELSGGSPADCLFTVVDLAGT